MPSLVIFKGEKSIDELAARLFQTTGEPQAGRQAADALLKANPQLSDLARLPPGSIVIVPDTPATAKPNEVLRPAKLVPTDFGRLMSEHVNGFASALTAQAADAATQADATLKLLQDPSLTAAAARDETLAQHLKAMSDNTKASLKDLEAKHATVQQGLTQLQHDLAKFAGQPTPPLQPPQPAPPPGGGPTAPQPQPTQPSPAPPARPGSPLLRASEPSSAAPAAPTVQPTQPPPPAPEPAAPATVSRSAPTERSPARRARTTKKKKKQ